MEYFNNCKSKTFGYIIYNHFSITQFLLHRLINNNDIIAVEKTISYLDKVSFESLPILPTGTCVIAGQCIQVPVMVDISEIDKEFEPDNKTIKLVMNWK